MKSNTLFLLGIILFCGFGELVAQKTVLQVVTKRIEKTFDYNPEYEVNIEGEKAEVQVETWQKNQISIELELIAKHQDKATARKDLDRMVYVTEKVKNKIYVRNYIQTEEGTKKPQSKLSAKYVVRLPENCPLYLKNYFGVANVSNLSNRLRINGEFSKIGLQNIHGSVDVRTRFGDLVGENIGGDVTINSRRSDLLLRDLSGRFNIEAYYGTIELFAFEDISDLNIVAEKSDIFLHDPYLSNYSYSVVSNYGKIEYPGDLKFNMMENTESLKKVQFKPKREYYPNITISITFGDVHLDKEKEKRSKP